MRRGQRIPLSLPLELRPPRLDELLDDPLDELDELLGECVPLEPAEREPLELSEPLPDIESRDDERPLSDIESLDDERPLSDAESLDDERSRVPDIDS